MTAGLCGNEYKMKIALFDLAARTLEPEFSPFAAWCAASCDAMQPTTACDTASVYHSICPRDNKEVFTCDESAMLDTIREEDVSSTGRHLAEGASALHLRSSLSASRSILPYPGQLTQIRFHPKPELEFGASCTQILFLQVLDGCRHGHLCQHKCKEPQPQLAIAMLTDFFNHLNHESGLDVIVSRGGQPPAAA